MVEVRPGPTRGQSSYRVMNEVLENQTGDYLIEVGRSKRREEMASLQGAPER
jgi:hypothetical protein